MKRRIADITAKFQGKDVVFELFTSTTNYSKVYDRDIFYFINNRQVFWIFGTESIINYNELRRSVAKDIMFSNRRNVFVFDKEAQEETTKRGELVLKCNWLDEDDKWHFQIKRDGKNGILVSLNQISFDDQFCRPYYFDADKPYYSKHPRAQRPKLLSREELKKSIEDSWNYNNGRKKAVQEMLQTGNGVSAFFDGTKWGFKYDTIIFIEPTYDEVSQIIGNFAKGRVGAKYGLINRFGDEILQPCYDAIEILHNSQVLYSDGEHWYLLGNIEPLVPYNSTDKVSVVLTKDDKNSFFLSIHTHDAQYRFYFFENEVFKYDSESAKWHLLISNGSITKENIVVDFHPLPNGYFTFKSQNGKCGIVDNQNNNVVNAEYDKIVPINDMYLSFQLNGKWGVMTMTGEILIEAKYKSVESATDNGFIVTITDTDSWEILTGQINLEGNPVREVIKELENGFVITKSFGRFGLECNSEIIVGHEYESLFHWVNDKFIAQKDDYFGIIDSRGNVKLSIEYSKIEADGNFANVKSGNQTFRINEECQEVAQEIIALQDGYKKVKLGGKWGICNEKGDYIVNCAYDEITTFRGRLIGIINGTLIKLSAYYPYRLQMTGINKNISGKDIVNVASINFQINPKRQNAPSGISAKIVLTNWTRGMRYPHASVFSSNTAARKMKHIDKPEDFIIGDTFTATVTNLILGYGNQKGKVRGVDVSLGNNMQSHIYKDDLIKSGIDINSISEGDKFTVIKMGYNEELDRTIWKVAKLL